MEAHVKPISPSFLSKILYGDAFTDNYGTHLNVNLLRHLKNYIKQQLNDVEKACLYEYHLENYIIDKALDPEVEAKYSSGNDLINDMLDFIRSRPDYWLFGSQKYIEIVNRRNCIEEEKYFNKDFVAIFNYSMMTKFKDETVFPVNYDNNLDKNEDPNCFLQNYLKNSETQKLLNDSDYFDFVRLIERENYFCVDESNIMLIHQSVIRHLFAFFKEGRKNFNEKFSLKLQNFILFVSSVYNNKEISDLLKNDEDSKMFEISSKKYRLRESKMNIEEFENLCVERMMKISAFKDQIEKIKKQEKVENFLNFLKNKKISTNISQFELNSNLSLNKTKLSLYSFIHLENILNLIHNYIEKIDEIPFSQNFDKMFETFKIFKNLFKTQNLPKTFIETDFLIFYKTIIESKNNYEGCIHQIISYNNQKIQKNFPKDEDLDKIKNDYLQNYYEHQNSNRLYLTENAFKNWTNEDFTKFDEAFEKFNKHQLANIKIAKYMGPHIEPNHVKLYRSKILKEKRQKIKEEKAKRMSEMKKKKYFRWKEKIE